MSDESANSPQPTTSSGPEPGSMEDWGAPESGERRSPDREPEPEPHKPEPTPVEGGDDEPTQAAADDDEPIGAEPDEGEDGDPPPSFWSAEDKALWNKLAPELRPIIAKYEKMRHDFADQKAAEAAAERKRALEEAQKAAGANEQYAKWWQENGPVFTKTFVDKWQGIDFDKLAEENPAEWARLSQLRTKEHQLLQQAHQQAEVGRAEQAKRAKDAEQQARLAEHNKLATLYPKEFGTPEAAKRTYDTLSKYLVDEGVPPETVSGIYDSVFVKLARKAYKYDQVRAKAKGITDPKPSAPSASATPTRVVPGARSSATPENDATRHAVERLKSGERLSREEASVAFR
jgi:hypothetical protein